MKYIVIEGVNGVGKTSLYEKLMEKHHEWDFTKEAMELNTFLENVDVPLPKHHKAVLYAYDRYINTYFDVKYHGGGLDGTVITDRSLLSSLVYNVRTTSKKEYDMIYKLNSFMPKPDLCIYLTADNEVIDKRLRERGEGNPFMQRDKNKYQKAIRYVTDFHDWNIETVDSGKETVELVSEVEQLIEGI